MSTATKKKTIISDKPLLVFRAISLEKLEHTIEDLRRLQVSYRDQGWTGLHVRTESVFTAMNICIHGTREETDEEHALRCASDAVAANTESQCCFSTCACPATHHISTYPHGIDDYTLSCAEHLGDLLTDDMIQVITKL